MAGKSNLNKYTVYRLTHFLSGLVLGVLFIFLPRNRNRIIFNSTHNNSFNFNTKYLFEYFLKKNAGWECWFVINDDAKREKLIAEYGPHFISSLGLKNKVFCLMARTWITSSLETPVGGILLSIRRQVLNLSHGVPIKSAGLDERSVPVYKKLYYFLVRTNFSGFLATSETTAEFFQKVFGCSRKKIVICSQPRLQPLVPFLNKSVRGNKYLDILYAPTWRQEGETLLFPWSDFDLEDFKKFLAANDMNILLRLHPYYENSNYTHQFLGPNIRMLSSKEAPEIMDVLSEMDGVISDYSSIYVDFLLLDRPVYFVPYDYETYTQKVGFIRDYESLTPGPHIKSYSEFKASLALLRKGEDPYREKRHKLNAELNGKISDPCAECYEYVVRSL
jgi:Putative glycosyl/glycerophosphate transferases involved in teichoic acid biosynthesis TagF/TagB/EpsJ/RodC